MNIGPVNVVNCDGILKSVVLEIRDGKIVRLVPTSADEQPLPWVVPSFIDLHIHGMGGFGPEQGTPEALWQMSQVLARQGVAAFCPTLYCAQPDKMAVQLRALSPALGKETGARILGFHLEGPFISPDKPGVMKPQDIAPANLDDFKKIYDAAQGHIMIVTLAPEVPGIRPVIDFCLSHRIIVQAGHTNATYAQMQEAFSWGVRRVTHWGNAMRGLHQREPGVLGAALTNPEISCEVIADGKHIHPALLALLKQVKPITQITAVTDALLPTAQTQGPLLANREEVVLQDGVWKRRADGVTAGSALTMAGAFAQLVRAGYTLPQAVAATGTNAARLLDIADGSIRVNAPANFAILTPDLQVQSVRINGQ